MRSSCKRGFALAMVLSLVILLLAPVTHAAPGLATPIGEKSMTLEQFHRVFRDELDDYQAFSNVAYVYLGWRTTGGPWFNAVLDWIAENLEALGFVEGMDVDGFRYWNQEDVRTGVIWDPKYASLEIISPGGHDDFNLYLDGFDPNSDYYPDYMNLEWLLHNIGSQGDAQLGERCRLATNSGFTDPTGTDPEEAGITAELVYVGQVLRSGGRYYWTENTGVDLEGKIIFATNSRSNAYSLAIQEGAVASLCSQISTYNNPIVDGEELNPTVAKYAGVSNSNPAGPVAFNLSPQDERFLISLAQSTGEPIMMRVVAIGDFHSFQDRPLRTLIAEIPGSSRPHERIVLAAHVQEPGANDNASGVGLQLELVRTLKTLIDEGTLPRPERTITFIFGTEMTMISLWSAAHPDQMANVKGAMVLDMVGQDPEKCGGIMRIEKTPDPSAIYKYGLDLLPGQEEPEMTTDFVRQPDKHTLWGAGSVWFRPYPGFYLNDLYFKAASLVSRDFPGFQVGSNPWEGGSDHDRFLSYKPGDEYSPVPAVLTWHFTDYFYHSNLDTMDKVSRDELRGVGLTTLNVAYFTAVAGENEALELMEIVRRQARERFAWEMDNSVGHLNWARQKAISEGKSKEEIAAAIDSALELEKEILEAWALWYKQALESSRTFCGEDVSVKYRQIEERNTREVDRLLREAVLKANLLAEKLKRQ